ncbi:primosomal replication protein N [Psittacicella gerlachiana]|uniref:Primosomal replication protein N n=1 Tax=Psittacicella gerlachiana TaxID=2028574 RepID=A0A3A1YGZ7_9GAMM|nr:primosomal replication protein N [Psittacicella gerlachiana]RIY36468.1 primosomal replication protein N [Psittacicella gerlachiana]
MENEITIDGTICVEPQKIISPSGIPHRQWTMQHQSERFEEVGLRRKVWLRLAVLVSGQELVNETDSYTIGTNVRCTGFISAHKSRKGDTQLILHAQKVEIVEFNKDEEEA